MTTATASDIEISRLAGEFGFGHRRARRVLERHGIEPVRRVGHVDLFDADEARKALRKQQIIDETYAAGRFPVLHGVEMRSV